MSMTGTSRAAREHDEIRLSRRRSGGPFLPLPALRGERVGVRGFLGKFDSWRVPLTRRSPDDAEPVIGRAFRATRWRRQESADLSPQAGRGDEKEAHHAILS
jgi:hypothetical protein